MPEEVPGRQYDIYHIPSLDRGMAPAFPMTVMPQEPEGGQGYTKLLKNVMFPRVPGQIEKRPASKEVLAPTDSEVLGAFEFIKKPDEESYIVAAHGNKLQYWDDGWSDIKDELTEAEHYDFRTFDNRLVVVNGQDDSFLWDGNEVTEPDDFPKAKFLSEYKGRLVVAGDPDEPVKLSVSHPQNPNLWDPTELGSLALEIFVSPDDGQKITGLMGMDDFVLIGQEHQLYGLFGTTTQDFAIYKVDPSVGVGSHKSMANIHGIAFFVDSRGNVYRYERGELPQRVSEPVDNIIKENVDTDYIHKARAFVMDSDFYVVSLPTGEDSRITLIYDTMENRWAQWDLEIGEPFYTHEGRERVEAYFTPAGGEKFLKLDKDKFEDEDESPVEMSVQSLDMHFGHPGTEKEVRTLFMRFRLTGDYHPFKLYYKVDGGDWSRPLRHELPEKEGYVTVSFPIGVTNCREFEFRLDSEEPLDIKVLDCLITYSVKEVE